MPTRLLYCLMLLLTGTGCCQDQDLPLNPAMSAWIPYGAGERVTFSSEGGRQLTFQAALSQYNQEGSDKACGTYDIETRQVVLTSLEEPGFKIQVTISHEILVGIKVSRDDPPGQSLNILFNTVSEGYISDPYRDNYLPSITLNGKTYPRVLKAYGNAGAGPLSFQEIYYGRDAGLVAFTLFTGEVFFLQ